LGDGFLGLLGLLYIAQLEMSPMIERLLELIKSWAMAITLSIIKHFKSNLDRQYIGHGNVLYWPRKELAFIKLRVTGGIYGINAKEGDMHS
jgi:hypothetical protein